MNKYFKNKNVRSYYAIIDGNYYLVTIFLGLTGVEVKDTHFFTENYIKDNFEECTELEFKEAKAEAISKL